MTNQTAQDYYHPLTSYLRQADPVTPVSDDLCFAGDLGSFIAHTSMKELFLQNIAEAPHIVLRAVPAKSMGYHLLAETTIEDDFDVDLHDRFSTHILRNLPAYAIDQIIRYANMASLSVMLYKNYSKVLVGQAEKLKEQRLPSLPYADTPADELKHLPLPYFITTSKAYEPSIIDENNRVVSKEEFDNETEEMELKAEEENLSNDEIDKKEAELEKRDEEINLAIEKIEKKYDITIEYTDNKALDKADEYDEETLLGAMPESADTETFRQRLPLLGITSEFIAILEYDEKGMPFYEVTHTNAKGDTVTMGRVTPHQGQLVSVVTDVLEVFQTNFIDPKTRDGRYQPLQGLDEFHYRNIKPFAEVLDHANAIKFGW